MLPPRHWIAIALVTVLAVACGGDSVSNPAPVPATAVNAVVEAPGPTATAPITTAPSATPRAPASSPTPQVLRQDIRSTRLTIPALSLDSGVQASLTVPYVYAPEPGCPPGPQDTETLTVPQQGIATPEDNLEGLENKAWIFGHSRWLSTPGLFFSLQDISLGDEVFIDGFDRASGAPIEAQLYIVDGIYLADTDSGETFLTAEDAEDIPSQPIVVLQTSVRERGAGKQWIIDQRSLLVKASNIVEGDLDDPCKYLLLFVTATRA